jgi:hypothetical protein
LELLGIIVDTHHVLFLLSQENLHMISRAARIFRRFCIQNNRRCTLLDLQRFYGVANSINLPVTDAHLLLRTLFNCAAAAHPNLRVVLCHQSLRDLEWWGDLLENQHVGRAFRDSTPTATLDTDASMEGWGAVFHTTRLIAGTQPPVALSVPARLLFAPEDAAPGSINQRELLAAILGLHSALAIARDIHVQLVSDSQVTLVVTRNWTSRPPRMMVLLRILRKFGEDNGISLGLQYLSRRGRLPRC